MTFSTSGLTFSLDEFRQRPRGNVFGLEETKFSATLTDADHRSLVEVFRGTVGSFSADESFVDFERAIQLSSALVIIDPALLGKTDPCCRRRAAVDGDGRVGYLVAIWDQRRVKSSVKLWI